jgi:hypothetical protein
LFSPPRILAPAFAPLVYGQQGKSWLAGMGQAPRESKVTVSIPASAELKRQQNQCEKKIDKVREPAFKAAQILLK